MIQSCTQKIIILLGATALASLAGVSQADSGVPFRNPHLSDSHYPSTHFRSDYTSLPGPVGPREGRRLRSDEVQWAPTGPVNSWSHLYSNAYPNGKRVIWVGGYDRIAKLDAETLETLTTFALGDKTYYGDQEINRLMDLYDKGDAEAEAKWVNVWTGAFPSAFTIYRVVANDGVLYIPHRSVDGESSVRAYGDDGVNPESEIKLLREWDVPDELSGSAIFGMMMTSDGYLVMTTQDGVLIALSTDFKHAETIKLPRRETPGETYDLFTSFVRNSISIDDAGGVYVVSRENLHRVQWTGEKFSLEEKDGAWTAPYPFGTGAGSSTTPSLMGWGPDMDHLVLIGNSNENNDIMAFWRHDIPDDWEGLEGYDRRVAGVIPLDFGVYENEKNHLENALTVHGYGAFTNDTYPDEAIKRANPFLQWLHDSYRLHEPGTESLGAMKVEWNPETRKLEKAWNTQANFASGLCMISDANEILYCWGARNGEWTLEGVDWATGERKFHYILGKSHRYNIFGGFVIVNPDGSIDCACPGGMGIVRITPRQSENQILKAFDFKNIVPAEREVPHE